jgi:23S rRNA pseudouridine1911/1915/1917 synthase
MAGASHSFRFVVDAAHDGLRVDTFLSSRLRNHVPARVQRLATAGLVTVDDAPCAADRRVFRGEEVALRVAEPPEPFYAPEPIDVDVLYDDAWLLAVNKPAGLIAHPVGPVGDGTLANVAQCLLDEQTRHPGLLRPGIVHRLDRATSGVMLIAKDHASHAGLTHQFERSQVAKCYVARVYGHVRDASGRIERPIGQAPGSLLMATAADAVAPRPAATDFRVVERLRSTTLLEVRPLTGRKHQIRVHLAAIGHPVVGDESYGTADIEVPKSETRNGRGATRHALHAAAITFRHPVTNALLRIVAPVPADFWIVTGR